MKFVANGLDMNDAITTVAKALPVRDLVPILECVKITAEGDTVTLYATDKDLAIEKKIKANIGVEGSIIVPGKVLVEYIRNIADENDIVFAVEDNNKLVINSSTSQCTIQCMDIDEYPQKDKIKKEEYFLTTEKNLKEVISKVIFSVATDDTRPILKGVFVEAKDYTLTAVATDGFRFAKCKKPLEEKCDGVSAIIPARSLNELQKMLSNEDDYVKVYVEKNFIFVNLPNTTFSTTLITNSQYVNYENLIPKEFSSTVIADKQVFEKALSTAAIMTKGDKYNLVSFEIEEYSMKIKSVSEIGTVEENIAILLKGMDTKCSYNLKYIMDCLKNIDSEAVKLEFTTHSNCVITMNGSDETIYFILPVRIYR